MLEKLKTASWGRLLPLVGIVAFSACSVHAVNQLLQAAAANPTSLYFAAACLIEAFTAFLVYQVVETVRKVTKSIGKGNPKEARRFNSVVLVFFVAAAIPSLTVSVVANAKEFGDPLLGLLFPTLCVGCAVAAAIPEAVKKRKKDKADIDAQDKRQKAQKATKAATEITQTLQELGQTATKILAILANDPKTPRKEIAKAAQVTSQSVGYHLDRLAKQGIIERNGKGIEVVVDLPTGWGNGGAL